MSDFNSKCEDLEIVAGQMWSAVGGADDGNVTVVQVDPKRYGIETCASTTATWLPADNGKTQGIELATIRVFKPMDLMVVERLNDGDGEIAIVTGYTDIEEIEINGTNQFNSKNPVPSVVFGTALSAPRPKVRFDSIQTSPNLTADLRHSGSEVPASGILTAVLVFSGVSVKR